MNCKFIEGNRYYCDRNSDYQIRVCSRSPKYLTVSCVIKSREKLMVDDNGDEYIEIKDPYHGSFRYSAKNVC